MMDNGNFSSLREREVAASEKQANATEAKVGKEMALIDLQMIQSSQDRIVSLLKQRKELSDQGYDSSDLDKYLPLPKS